MGGGGSNHRREQLDIEADAVVGSCQHLFTVFP